MDTDVIDGMQDGEQQITTAACGHETVIKFVLSGPVLSGETAAHVAHLLQADDVGALRERVAVLERALADTQAQLQSLAVTVAGAISSGVRSGAPGVARPEQAAWTAGPGSVGPPSAAAALAVGIPSSDRIPLAVVPSREAGPEPEPLAAAPKARGLRRMISVLKHDH